MTGLILAIFGFTGFEEISKTKLKNIKLISTHLEIFLEKLFAVYIRQRTVTRYFFGLHSSPVGGGFSSSSKWNFGQIDIQTRKMVFRDGRDG